MRETQLGSYFHSEENPLRNHDETRMTPVACAGRGCHGIVADSPCSRCLCLSQWPGADEAYFIAKEILATERTYLKDLEVITVVSNLRPFLLGCPRCRLTLPGGRRPPRPPEASLGPGADTPCSLNQISVRRPIGWGRGPHFL